MQKSGLQKRPRRRKMIRAMGGCIGVFLLTFVFILVKPHAEPYRMYVDEYEAAQEAGDDVKAIFPPIRYSPRQTGFRPLEKPSSQHILGVDQSTRDVAVRLLYGTRISLSIGVIAVSIYVTIGIIMGATAGFFGGWVDIGIQRLIEVTMCVPSLFVILTLVAFVEEPSIFHIMVIIGLVRWTGVARLTRGEYLRLRSLDFVTAARALGYPRRRIIFQQILPNALGPVLVAAPFGVASAILFEATLSFLGLGDVSAPSWGQTLQEGYASGSWHLILAPGFAIFITVFLLNVAGEALRDALDPKMRK
jgi:peptide/nickel transport system permease protein